MTTYLLDANVLLALSLPTHQHHAAASDWFGSDVQWATTPMTETAYLRLMSNPSVVGYQIPVSAVITALSKMRGLDGHHFIGDSTSLAESTLQVSHLTGTKLVTDVHLVNLAASVEAVLATFDGRLLRALHPDDRRFVELLDD